MCMINLTFVLRSLKGSYYGNQLIFEATKINIDTTVIISDGVLQRIGISQFRFQQVNR